MILDKNTREAMILCCLLRQKLYLRKLIKGYSCCLISNHHNSITMNVKTQNAERAVLEAMVNHSIHRDYTVMGGEVHLDIYDDYFTIRSPGGMYNGMLIQDLDIADVSSERRNPQIKGVTTGIKWE